MCRDGRNWEMTYEAAIQELVDHLEGIEGYRWPGKFPNNRDGILVWSEASIFDRFGGSGH